MKLSYRTIEALYELSKVSPMVLICRDGDLFALDATINLRATAQVPDRFPRNVAFYDIWSFLGPLGVHGPQNADVTFDSKRCRVTTPEGQYFQAIANPLDLRELLRLKAEASRGQLRTLCKFTIGHKLLRILQETIKGIKKKNTYEMRLASDGMTTSLTLQWRPSKARIQEGGLASFRQPLGKCPKSFAFLFPISVLSPLPIDDYAGVLTARQKIPELRLTASTRRITYSACLSVSTVETLIPQSTRKA